ncbi:MAG: aminodeoxychorismate/anthranilate synthase component II [Clostridiales bacterium]|nr:aminodeoxychorismate/anthranilate synthase component II [Clostridiales bacterium]
MILIIDNYDGCANNIYQLAGQLDPNIRIVRNDQIDAAAVRAQEPSHIILSGGSTEPERAGCAMEIVKNLAGQVPILGICLGYRIICAAYGGRSVQMEEIRQGKRALIRVDTGSSLFQGLPDTFHAGLYHSETVPVENIPDQFSITAWDGGDAVAIAHKTQPVFGLQFHPESFLSEYGKEIMANFLASTAL